MLIGLPSESLGFHALSAILWKLPTGFGNGFIYNLLIRSFPDPRIVLLLLSVENWQKYLPNHSGVFAIISYLFVSLPFVFLYKTA